MAEYNPAENLERTITVGGLNGRKATSTGKEYFELTDRAKNKYRIYSESLYNRFKIGAEYDIEYNDFSGNFVNEKGKSIDYTIHTITNILSVPLDTENEPIDEAISQLPEEEPKQEKIVDEKPDWDEIAKGKVRHGVAIAFIEQGRELTKETKLEMLTWVNWIVNGE